MTSAEKLDGMLSQPFTTASPRAQIFFSVFSLTRLSLAGLSSPPAETGAAASTVIPQPGLEGGLGRLSCGLWPHDPHILLLLILNRCCVIERAPYIYVERRYGHPVRILAPARLGSSRDRRPAGRVPAGTAQRDRRPLVLRRQQPAPGLDRPSHDLGRPGRCRGRNGRLRSGVGLRRGRRSLGPALGEVRRPARFRLPRGGSARPLPGLRPGGGGPGRAAAPPPAAGAVLALAETAARRGGQPDHPGAARPRAAG